MNDDLDNKTTEQQAQQFELPWDNPKYKRLEPDGAPIPTEQQLLQERIWKKDVSIAKEALLREADVATREVGYSARLLVQATLPHSKPADGEFYFERVNGHTAVKIIADPNYGLPFGTYPRLLLTGVTTEATRTKSPQLVLGNSLSEFMSKLDLNSPGREGRASGGQQGSMPRIRQHMQRLFSSTVAATYERDGQWMDVGFRPVEKAHIFWNPRSPEQCALWNSTITLNKSFYDELVRHPVPVDMAALRKLAKTKSPLAIDIYQWLTYRVSYLREDVTIPWESLRLQFGCSQSEGMHLRRFKSWFAQRLKQVVDVYPDARVSVCDAGLLLLPSPTHVPVLSPKTKR